MTFAPAIDKFRDDDRVISLIDSSRGKILYPPPIERTSMYTNWVWVAWNDGVSTWTDPSTLDYDF